MGKLSVSNNLQAFFEKKFQSMVDAQRELENKRKSRRPEMKRRERQMKSCLGQLNRLKSNGILYDDEYKKLRSRCFTKNISEALLKGKSKVFLNEFVYNCDYLLHKENEGARTQIHSWISEYLASKGYKKDNHKPYTANDIKRIINYEFEDYSPIYDYRDLFWNSFDREYESFCTQGHSSS